MIGISKLYCGTVEPSDVLRYGRQAKQMPSHLLQFSEDKKPVVVFNCTKACNLSCVHCYASSNGGRGKDELSTNQALTFIDSLAEFGSPVILFSGGEPLTRKDIFQLVGYAAKQGLRVVISTNGTLIDIDTAKKLADIGLSYVGVSLDGIGSVNDAFRGKEGAFDRAVEGIGNCQKANLKVGLRFTVNKRNVEEVPKLFDLIHERNIPRICFYHLVYTGRGTEIMKEDLGHERTRKVVDLIMDRTKALHENGEFCEVLTVDNHADGPYLLMRLNQENKVRAQQVHQLLQYNGGNSSGHGIGCVSWDGTVYPDQFWRNRILGNIKDKPFGEIWTDKENEFLQKLKDKKSYITGRCSQCRFLDICGGNFRCRAEVVHDDPWAPDPACYLTDEEIGL